MNQELIRLASAHSPKGSMEKLLKRPEISYQDLPDRNDDLSEEVVQQVEIAVKYAGYIARQEVEIEKFRSVEEKRIPDWFDYDSIPSMRNESRQKLKEIRPATLGQASRISGISPADISLVMVWMKRGAPEGSKISSESD
jgi:tRNA uridine 5-carboxymethylaminomethyl modification enzyme